MQHCDFAGNLAPSTPSYPEGYPCVFHTVEADNFTRTFEYTLDYYEYGDCESMYVVPAWYRYENDKDIPTQPATPGQCGSWNPIWLNGKSISSSISQIRKFVSNFFNFKMNYQIRQNYYKCDICFTLLG